MRIFYISFQFMSIVSYNFWQKLFDKIRQNTTFFDIMISKILKIKSPWVEGLFWVIIHQWFLFFTLIFIFCFNFVRLRFWNCHLEPSHLTQLTPIQLVLRGQCHSLWTSHLGKHYLLSSSVQHIYSSDLSTQWTYLP